MNASFCSCVTQQQHGKQFGLTFGTIGGAGQDYVRIICYSSPYVLCKQESLNQECSGSVVECLTPDRGAAGSSFTGVTALWSLNKNINPSLVLVQPGRPVPERLLMGRKESNQTNKSIKIVHFCKLPRAILVCVPAFLLLEAILAHCIK